LNTESRYVQSLTDNKATLPNKGAAQVPLRLNAVSSIHGTQYTSTPVFQALEAEAPTSKMMLLRRREFQEARNKKGKPFRDKASKTREEIGWQ